MNGTTPIKLLFRLLNRFVPMEDGEYTRTLDQATNWWNEEVKTDEPQKGFKGLLAKYKAWSGQWYGVVTHAIAYIVLVRLISDFMSSERDPADYVD